MHLLSRSLHLTVCLLNCIRVSADKTGKAELQRGCEKKSFEILPKRMRYCFIFFTRLLATYESLGNDFGDGMVHDIPSNEVRRWSIAERPASAQSMSADESLTHSETYVQQIL